MLLFLNPTIKTQWKVWLFIQTFHCVFQHIHRRSSSFSALWIYTILKPKQRLLYHALVLYYLMDLHYSQTTNELAFAKATFHYLMNLHYSQTRGEPIITTGKFHYLMNLHYSQTNTGQMSQQQFVSLPYEFTLFSNQIPVLIQDGLSFTTLWIYTILKLRVTCLAGV